MISSSSGTSPCGPGDEAIERLSQGDRGINGGDPLAGWRPFMPRKRLDSVARLGMIARRVMGRKTSHDRDRPYDC